MKNARSIVASILMSVAVCAALSLVCITNSVLPAGETIDQWCWFDKTALLAAGFIVLSFLVWFKRDSLDFSFAVSWSLILLGSVEAIWGLRQLYGFTSSNHSLFALTGSFFNPGPYSGYLAMTLPICLHQWLVCRKKEGMLRQAQHGRWSWEMIMLRAEYVATSLAMLLILCVLPAGMSRSAWLAAGISCSWVYGIHAGWGDYIRDKWWLHKRQIAGITIGIICISILAGFLFFSLKPDSARGRFFMWRITCYAIAEEPLLGHGIGNFAAAYGDAQEAYFAADDYEPWEERVAGSPEYAFNEYLQVAVEVGIPLALCLLAVILTCLYVGVQKQRYGVCGAILFLMIFSFSSYPLQLPVFVVTSIVLLLACVLNNRRWQWLVLALLTAVIGGLRLPSDHRLPGRIYPYYLLAKLYAETSFREPEKLEEMKRIVLTKEPKVNSTAIREMREEVKKLCSNR